MEQEQERARERKKAKAARLAKQQQEAKDARKIGPKGVAAIGVALALVGLIIWMV